MERASPLLRLSFFRLMESTSRVIAASIVAVWIMLISIGWIGLQLQLVSPHVFVRLIAGAISYGPLLWLFMKYVSDFKELQNRRIFLAPGSLPLKITEFFFPQKIHLQHFVPFIAEMRDEYQSRLEAGRAWAARWCWLRDCLRFWLKAIAELPIKKLKNLLGK